jgi:hypothetical protein
MHVEADLLDDICDVGAGECQVLKGPSEAPEVNRINNRRPRLNGDLGMRVHRRQNWLAIHHISSLKNIESKLMLSEEETVRLMFYGDSQEIIEGPKIIRCEFPLKSIYGLPQKCCTRCGEDNAINVKQQIYCICAAPKDE